MSSAEVVVSVDRFVKEYRTDFRRRRVMAVRGASFEVKRGEIFGFVGSNRLTSWAQSRRPARILATSIAKFMPIAQKKLRRGAKASTSSPASRPARRYSTPSASV